MTLGLQKNVCCQMLASRLKAMFSSSSAREVNAPLLLALAVPMSLQEFFQKQAMDENLAPKRGEIGGEGGDSPPKN